MEELKLEVLIKHSVLKISTKNFGVSCSVLISIPLFLQFVNSGTRKVEDSFRISRKKNSTNRKINIGK